MIRHCLIGLIWLLSCTTVYSQDSLDVISFALVGDIMLGNNYPEPILPPDGGREMLRSAHPYLMAADVAIGNLECAITSEQECAKTINEGMVYAFRMPPFLAGRLREAGFDVLSTANNHSMDFGLSGRSDTKMILEALGIAQTGMRDQAAIVDVDSVRIAVIGFSPYDADNSLLDIDRAVALVDSMDESADLIVVTFHGGAEGADNIHLGDTMEVYLGEERGDLRRFSYAVIDAGADIVFGHGPHVPRAMEVYSGRLIAYSLGNFCTYWGLNVRESSGFAPLLWVELSQTGELKKLRIISFEQQTNHYPILDESDRAGKLMIELSRTDIGSVHPLIEGAIAE
ncbi:MAG: CapA family protein [Candidatus Electryoneaceae bacterium]|nr:CapA family protein [Candidatus Electryoneaceae bacterium]